jgi:hypothetical protein
MLATVVALGAGGALGTEVTGVGSVVAGAGVTGAGSDPPHARSARETAEATETKGEVRTLFMTAANTRFRNLHATRIIAARD